MRKPINHSGVPAFRLLHCDVLEFLLEATLDYFPGFLQGPSRFGSPKGPERYACFYTTDPLDQLSGLLGDASPEVGEGNRVFRYLRPREPYEKTAVLFLLGPIIYGAWAP
jgi:hypothetical protein